MKPEQPTGHLPPRVAEYIDFVVRKTRYRKRVRREVRLELTAHFQDALAQCDNEKDRETLGDTLITEFGDGKLLATLIRRGKKRCRPLWKKTIIRTMQAAGILILLAGLRVAHLSSGSPTVKVNYIEWLNEQVRHGRDEALNGKPDFDRAVELGSRYWPDVLDESWGHWPGEMTEQERQEVGSFFQENAQSLAALRKAAAKPYLWFEYQGDPDFQTGDAFKSVMPFLTEYRMIAKRHGAVIMWRAYQGDVAGALDDSVVLQRLGHHLQGRGTLVGQLVGIAVEHLSWQAIATVVARVDVPTDVLLSVQCALEKENAKMPSPISVAAEKAFSYDYVQRTFTDDGKGGGGMLAKGLPFVVGGWHDILRGFVLGFPNRREALAMIERYFERGEETCTKTPWQSRQEQTRAGQDDKTFQGSLLLDLLIPAYDRAGQLGWRLKARRGAVVTILALERWQLAKGEYPESLEELVAGKYLGALPQDPYSDGALKYEPRGEDFVLYSLGADFDDDGGQDNQWGEGEGGGDHVFWPVRSKKLERKPRDVRVMHVMPGD